MPSRRSAAGTAAAIGCVLVALLAGCSRDAMISGSSQPSTPLPAVSSAPPSAVPSAQPITTAPTTAAPTTAAPTTKPTTTAPTTAAPTTKPIPTGSITAAPGLTLTGTVEEGVEPDCLLLTDERTGRRVNLAGADRAALAVGSRVTVTGAIGTDLKSYCQQGAIFVVATVRRAG